MADLTPELEKARKEIIKIAAGYGLDFYDTIFEVVTYDQMNQIAAHGGFPTRYPHWRFGMEYEQLSKGYEYGLSKIYEMVINTDPCYAYLMEGNAFVDQKLVMAHVYGHCDFFKNNKWFSKTNTKMMDVMANNATKVRRFIDRFGIENVENFIDVCLSLENLIDRYSPYMPTSAASSGAGEGDGSDVYKLRVDKDYMDEYINPPEFVESQRKRDFETQQQMSRYPAKPARDVLQFLVYNAPIKAWQQEILSLIREEAYYMAPQGMTKIMNEGWASYWHTTMMTQDILVDSEVIDYADHHSGTVAMSPTGFNPYKIGLELFRDIEERWNKGQFGKEWRDCENLKERTNWDKKLGLGRKKIFEVRRDYNDVTFIDEFLSEEFCVKNKMFIYKFNQRTGLYEIDTRNFPAVKKQLLFHLTNFGQPIIQVEDANYSNRGELLLHHLHEGVDMQPDYMIETLKNVHIVWGRPVHMLTVMDDEKRLYTFDGREVSDSPVSELP